MPLVCLSLCGSDDSDNKFKHFAALQAIHSRFLPSYLPPLSLSLSLSCSCYSCSFCLCSHCQFAFCSIYSDALTLHFGPTFRFQLASSSIQGINTHRHTHTVTHIYAHIGSVGPPPAPPFLFWLLPMCCTLHFGQQPKENFIFGHLAKLAAYLPLQ